MQTLILIFMIIPAFYKITDGLIFTWVFTSNINAINQLFWFANVYRTREYSCVATTHELLKYNHYLNKLVY